MMKVTVLGNNQKMALERGSLDGELQKTDARGRCGAGLLCVFGLMLGFVVSHLVVGFCSQDIYDGGAVELMLIPENIVLQQDQSYGRIDETFLSLRSTWMSDPENNLGDSLLMAAMLNIVQQNLLEEIKREGFIIVEGHADPPTSSVETIGEGMPLSVDIELSLEHQPGLDQMVKSFESMLSLPETRDTGLVFQQQLKPTLIESLLYQNTPYLYQQSNTQQNGVDGVFSLFEDLDLNEIPTGNDDLSTETPSKDSDIASDSLDRAAEDLELLRKYLDVPDWTSSSPDSQEEDATEIIGTEQTNDGSQDETYDDLRKVLEYLDVPDLPAITSVDADGQ